LLPGWQVWYASGMNNLWQQDLERIITRPADLPPFIDLTDNEQALQAAPHNRLPMRLSPYIVSRMARAAGEAGGHLPPDHPLRRLFIPTSAERTVREHELPDPLGENLHSPLPRLVHRYADRALLLVTDQCAVHCRHCFRSRFTARGHGTISRGELEVVTAYLSGRPGIREVLLSGGDALMLTDEELSDVATAVRGALPDAVIRIATRIPVTLPSRVTPALAALLRRFAPAWLVVQINHPSELGDEADDALARLVDSGIPVVNQSVLLAGINDSEEVLEELFSALVRRRIKPYYLFQGDLAPGTSHFRVNLERAIGIARGLRTRVSGLAMPVFAVDIPGGAGKVPLEPSAVIGEDAEGHQLRGPDGSVYHYPRE